MRCVGIVVTEQVRVFDYAVASEVWGLDRTDRGVPAFDLRTCGPRGHALTMSTGVTCVPDHGLDGLDECDLVIVPGVQNPARAAHPDVVTALRAAHDRGATVASLCSGAFVLAAAGLLDGRKATAHWLDVDQLAQRHPDVSVDPGVLFVGDGTVWTSAGVAAGIDLCLHLVRRDHGAAAAAEIARTMVTAPFRPGGQAQFITRPVPAGGGPSDSLTGLRERMLDDLAHPWTVPELANLARMSERSFARRCGFSTPLTLRHHFTRHVGLPPRDYRLAFGRRPEAERSRSAR
ncbi:GlxA family transcriptional regulator [Actinomadura sp. ATCC 39365]